MPKKLFLTLWAGLLLFTGASLLEAEELNLPAPRLSGPLSLEEAILHRRSERDFKDTPLKLEHISQLLWAGQGITDTAFNFRAAPSSGALYPLSLLVAKSDGVFKYFPGENKLRKITREDKRPSLVRAALGQSFIGEAPVVVIITGSPDKSREKYGLRGDRYVFIEAGHVAENICLQATALGLGSIAVGSFWDDVVASALECPPLEAPIYLIPVGYLNP